MLSMAGTNLIGILAFGALYGLAAARVLPESLFLPTLLFLFALFTAFWLRVEGNLPPAGSTARRVGRAAAALALCLFAAPALILAPLFALAPRLPPEAKFDAFLSGVMVILLISAGLTVAANVAGVVARLVSRVRTTGR